MPKREKSALVQQVKANPFLRQTVLWFISSRDGRLDRLKARLIGAQGYLNKPFRVEELLAIATSV